MDPSPYRRDGRLTARCLCGDVSIVIDGGYRAAVGACHCTMCRRWSGMAFAGFEADPGAVSVTGEVARYRSSDFAERVFCPGCGSHLWFRDLGDDTPYEFAPGIFPDAADFPLISEIYVDQVPAHAKLAGNHRRATRAEYEAGHLFVEGDDP